MTRFSATRIFAIRIVVALGMCALISCQPPPPNTGAAADHGQELQTGLVGVSPTRDLSRDEAAGGHILRKHVGQTEEQLRERLERERDITGASTYTDRSTAEHAVGAAIAQSQDQIQNWLQRPGRHPNLVLDYDSDGPIGRTMNRGEVHSRGCAHALVVLRYTGPNHFYVLTSYPECRS
jgi:CDI toxin RNase A-like protein